MIYASFWQRLAAMLIDILVLLPILAFFELVNTGTKLSEIILLIPTAITYDCYTVYCHGRYGQTIGKRVMGISVVLVSGKAIGWREAWLRSSVDIFFTVLGISSSFMALIAINNVQTESVGWFQHVKDLHKYEPVWLNWTEDAQGIWGLSEVIIMLLNKKRQSLHDFIAGTVVIKNIDIFQQEAHQGIINQAKSDDENLIVTLPRWLVFCAFLGMVIVAISNKSQDDEPISKPASLKPPDIPITIEKPIEKEIYHSRIININTASIEELQTLPRISESIALAIIDGRPYSSVDDLIQVYGIGPKTLERIKPYVKTKD